MEVSESGLPKVDGLDLFIKQDDAPLEDKGAQQQEQQVQAPSEEGQAPQTMTDEEILAQFKSTKDLLKSYKEIQGFTTRVSQENKEKARQIEELQGRLNQLQEEIELRRYQSPRPQQPPKSFEELFIENPEMAITMKANEIATAQRIREVAEEEYNKNPQEYHERAGWVQKIAQDPRLQALAFSPQGVRKLFQIADDTRKKVLQANAHKAIKEIFGDNVDMEKLRSIFSNTGNTQPTTTQTNNLNAYMPNTGTSTRTGADINQNINSITARKEEALKKGDVSGVAKSLLMEALAK